MDMVEAVGLQPALNFQAAASHCRVGRHMVRTYGLERKASRGFEPRSLDSESRVLTVTPRGRMLVRQVPHVLTKCMRGACALLRGLQGDVVLHDYILFIFQHWQVADNGRKHPQGSGRVSTNYLHISKHPPWGSNPRPQG